MGDVTCTTHRSSRFFFPSIIFIIAARARARVLDDRLDRGSMKEHTTIAVLKHIDSTRNSGAARKRAKVLSFGSLSSEIGRAHV